MVSEVKVEEIISALTEVILEYIDAMKNNGIDVVCNEI